MSENVANPSQPETKDLAPNVRHNVRIVNQGPGAMGTHIYIDGQEVKGVTQYTLHATATSLQRLTLTMFVRDVEVEVEDVEVVVE